jgi:3-hydroxy-9,10-secoandrosta-1,3,5(10)-triene-9,17-dione monooxygenase reductase component
MVTTAVDATSFRKALGHFATGVTVITTMDGAEPVGFACQSFAALSLDPPLVLFCPGKNSRTWPAIEAAGTFCVNILAHDQQDVSATFGRSGDDKFASCTWSPAPSGAPRIDGVLTWIDCTVENVVDGGDHWIVVGRVTALGEADDERPLLFYRGAYSATEQAEPTPGIMDNLITWSRDDDWF